MPSKRDVLAHLTREELVALTDTFDIAVEDRRSKEKMADAVAGSKKASLPDILADYPRDRLKELCRALGLDGGREKAALIGRLTGPSSGGAATAAPAPPAKAKASGKGEV